MAVVTHMRALQALEMAIRKGSLKEAAAELSITAAALGQRIRALEDYLGFDLLVRGRSGIRPTRELEGALAHLGAAFRELETVTDILDFQRVNEVHITADLDWAELWLKPRLPRFREVHPNTLFCINGVGDVPVRLGEADCEVRFARPANDESQELLFHDFLLPLSSPENTRRVLAQSGTEILEGFPLLHLDCYTQDGGGIGWPEWIAKYGHRKTSPGVGIRYKRVVHALEAVYADSGFIVSGLALTRPLLEEGVLATPFPKADGAWTKNGYFVRFSPSGLRREQTEQFRLWLLKEAEESYAELRELSGEKL